MAKTLPPMHPGEVLRTAEKAIGKALAKIVLVSRDAA